MGRGSVEKSRVGPRVPAGVETEGAKVIEMSKRFKPAEQGDHVAFEDFKNLAVRRGKVERILGGGRFSVLVDNTMDYVTVKQLGQDWFVTPPDALPEAAKTTEEETQA